MIALGSETWDPVSIVISSLRKAMLRGEWLVLEELLSYASLAKRAAAALAGTVGWSQGWVCCLEMASGTLSCTLGLS